MYTNCCMMKMQMHQTGQKPMKNQSAFTVLAPANFEVCGVRSYEGATAKFSVVSKLQIIHLLHETQASFQHLRDADPCKRHAAMMFYTCFPPPSP